MSLEWSSASQELSNVRSSEANLERTADAAAASSSVSTTTQKGETLSTAAQISTGSTTSSATRISFNRYPSAATPSSTSTLLQRSPDEPTRSRLQFADDSGKTLAVVEFSDSLHYSPTKAAVEPSKCSPGPCCVIA